MTEHDDPAIDTLAAQARRLLRTSATATLATTTAEDEGPYASLVTVACRHDGAPILLLSELAEHTRNITQDNRVALLCDDTGGLEDPLSGARVTLLGQAVASEGERDRARYLARHPAAAIYAEFDDFSFYRIEMRRAHLVAGFGCIDWIESGDFLLDAARCAALAERENDIVTHMNDDHADAVDLYATHLLKRPGAGWRVTGCDPEGCDLRRQREVARLDFVNKVWDANGARRALVDLAYRARQAL